MISIEKSQPKSKEMGGPKYVNPNCWLAKTVNGAPTNRCRYCEMKFQKCPVLRYFIITLVLVPLSLSIIFLIERKVSEAVIISFFLFIISYGYFFNKSTERLIFTNFSLKKAKKTLEESRSTLEIKVRARTKELQEVLGSLEQQVEKKTEELRTKLNDLERFRKLAVGRELKMIELKKEIRKLKGELGKKK